MKKILGIILAVFIITTLLAGAMGSVISAEEITSDNAVASIGTQYFSSLNDAIKAANDGDTILVHKDTTISTTNLTSKSLTIRGEGATKPVITGSSLAFKLFASSNITLENLSFVGFIYLIHYGTSSASDDSYRITLDNVDVSFAAAGAVYGYSAKKLELIVSNSSFTSAKTGQAVLRATIAPSEACYVKFENNTYNNGCVEVNQNSEGVILPYEDETESNMIFGDAEALGKGAVARVGELAAGNMGEVYHKDLAEAVNVAKDGDTIYILSGISGFSGVTYSNKTLIFVGVNKSTIKPGNTNYAFTLKDGAGIVIENLKFSGYDGKNLILFAKDDATACSYDITLKQTEVSFSASGAIYGYTCKEAIVMIEDCKFNAGVAGNCLLNFTNATCYEASTLTLKDVALNENCGVVNTNAAKTTVNEMFTSDAKALAAGMRVRAGETEGGKVGVVYYRMIDEQSLKGFTSGTKFTVFCECGAKNDVTSINCATSVTCTGCGAVNADLAEHEYTQATCQNKATCMNCGVQKGDLANHNYSEATCQKKATCTWCQAEIGELATHDYTKATCTEKAKCKICGVETGELVAHADSNSDGKCDSCNVVLNVNDTANTTPADPQNTNPTDDGFKNDTTGEEKGCGGMVSATALALIAVVSSCAIITEKKRR